MKSRRLIAIISILLVLVKIDLYAQKDLTISGGNAVSSMVCSNQIVYVCGLNTVTSGTGVLGVGSTNTLESSWKQVIFPNNAAGNSVTMKQVNSGSGASFVSVDCNGSVWGWGDNTFGQVGNNTSGNVVSTPVQVKVGAAGAAFNDGYGNLTNVDVVYAGNENSYAILNDGRLVAWGNNSGSSVGMLGDGTTTNRLTPVFVKKPDGTDLTNVIQVFSGDNVTAALVDADGDGVGTVYTWGTGLNGTLGRNANGTVWTTSASDSYARPVKNANGTDLNNIKAIAIGDVLGMALDVNGYVWTWGNAGWNGSTGWGNQNTSGVPARVIKGLTTGASNDGNFLLAKAIGGGQGYAMALTVDGKPVAWGGGGCSGGGAIGNGTLTGGTSPTTGPEYIKYAAGMVHNDVILINRGDSWGFYGRADGSMWAWGCNTNGTLGIGNTTSQAYAVRINPPSTCTFRDPSPTVNLSPIDMTVCESEFTGQILDAGFIVSTALAASYRIEWFKNGGATPVSTGTVLANGTTYTALTPGTYKVVITYIGTNGGCDSYDPAEAEMTISTWPATFTAPTNLTYCGTTATVNVNSINTKGVYNWFLTNASTVVKDTTIGSGTSVMDITGATAGTGTDKIVYVEEIAYSNGSVITAAQIGSLTDGDSYQSTTNVDVDNSFATGFTVSEPITITELSYMAKTIIPDWPSGFTQMVSATNPCTATIDVSFKIYAARPYNAGYIADDSQVLGTLTGTYTRTRGADAQSKTEAAIIKGSVTLPPGMYFIAVSGCSSNVNFQEFKVCRNGTPVSGAVDNVTGQIIKHDIGVCGYGNPNQTNSGMVYDVKFKTAQHYCDRLPVVLKESCPCVDPTNPAALASTDTDRYLCPAGSTTLSTTTTQPNGTGFEWVWYKGSIASGNIISPTPVTQAAAPTLSVAYGDITAATTYYLLVRDKAMPTQSACWDTVNIVLTPASLPTYTVTGGGTVCEGTSTPAVTVNLTGSQPFDITWNQTGTATGSGSPTVTTGSYSCLIPCYIKRLTAC